MMYAPMPSVSPSHAFRHAMAVVASAVVLLGSVACDTNEGAEDPPLDPGTFQATVEPGPQLNGEARYRLRAAAGASDTTFMLRLRAGTTTFPSQVGGPADSTVATGIFIQLPRSTPPVPGEYDLEQDGPFFLGPSQVVLPAPESSLGFPILYNIESGTLTVTRVESGRVSGEIDASARSLPSGLGPSTVEVAGRFVALPGAMP